MLLSNAVVHLASEQTAMTEKTIASVVCSTMDDILQTQDATLSKMTKQPHAIATPVLTQMPALAPAPMPAPITAFSSSLSPPVVNVLDPTSLPVGP